MTSNSPTLIISQDYELFFQRSGSIERCLFDPCDELLAFADANAIKYTFFVDAGMLLAMRRFVHQHSALSGMLEKVQRHIESLAASGHEIALHVHPHWEDSRWSDGGWDFQNTRYQLGMFEEHEVMAIFHRYSHCLAELSGKMPSSYRAGGFCVEPFDVVGRALAENGIYVDSSVVPGAVLHDDDKGFDFSSAPDEASWRFESNPSVPVSDGKFLQIPITPQKLPLFYYWGRLAERLGSRTVDQKFGDGQSKAIGRREIIRRLLAQSRTAELSIDDAKAQHLLHPRIVNSARPVWHLMGHPKLVSARALANLKQFMGLMGIEGSETVSAFADRLRVSD